MTLGRCPLRILCSRGTPPVRQERVVLGIMPLWRDHAPVDVLNETPLGQPTLSLLQAHTLVYVREEGLEELVRPVTPEDVPAQLTHRCSTPWTLP